ncbi:MAG TPA: hypothetical protein VH234_02295 [Candidatus Saccharimonadales bacterium]|jgi:hypothetical protein|nr:hypothetical protein [Candidatus Saccharimonadales bacterium]
MSIQSQEHTALTEDDRVDYEAMQRHKRGDLIAPRDIADFGHLTALPMDDGPAAIDTALAMDAYFSEGVRRERKGDFYWAKDSYAQAHRKGNQIRVAHELIERLSIPK